MEKSKIKHILAKHFENTVIIIGASIIAYIIAPMIWNYPEHALIGLMLGATLIPLTLFDSKLLKWVYKYKAPCERDDN